MMLCSWNKAIGEEQILSRSIFLSKLLGFVNAARLRLANPNLPPKLQKNNSPLVAGVMSPAGIGETHDASLLPENFDPAFYLRMNPDLGAVDPVHHYLNHGRHDAWRVVTLPLVHRSETHAFNPELDTILVVSHEASRSGAPILALNLVERLSVRYNVVVLLLGNGPLLGAFKNAAVATVSSPALRHNAEYAQLAIQQLSVEFSFQFALVNSMECNLVLEPLARNFIPSVYLIHEFASAYPNSQALLSDTLLWSSEVVFSAGLTQENAQDSFPAFKHFPTHILPQGRCVLTEQKGSEDQARMEADKLREQIRPKSDTDRKFVVFGAGYVNFRKGVDLFIQCAIKAMNSPGGERFRFVWIGQGYMQGAEDGYSVYLADQIKRSGLRDRFVILGETSAISTAYEEADVLFISSRLDPLPNVAIDAIAERLPVVCFDKASGISDFLSSCGLRDVCVANYLDVTSAAEKIFALADSSSLYEQAVNLSYDAAATYFDMDSYVRKIEALGVSASRRTRQEKQDVDTIVESGLLVGGNGAAVVQDVLSNIRGRARGMSVPPLVAGFQPDAYVSERGLAVAGSDPFADYLRAGSPRGVWDRCG